MPVLPITPIDVVRFGTTSADAIDGGTANDLIQTGASADTVNGLDGDDVIFGNRGADALSGGAGADVVVWTNGDGSDIVDGGDSFDIQVVEGNPAAGETFALQADGGIALFERTGDAPFQLELNNVEELNLQSLGGDDQLTIGAMAATEVVRVNLRGGEGADTLDAQASDIPILAEGEDGIDQLVGGSGADQLHGGNGGDTLGGGEGGDWLVGGSGADSLNGGPGRDVLEGEAGDDNLTGGTDADAFVIESGEGSDTITDFETGSDLIVLRDLGTPGGSPPTFADLTITVSGSDSVVDLAPYGSGGSLTVTGISTLAAEDFVFL